MNLQEIRISKSEIQNKFEIPNSNHQNRLAAALFLAGMWLRGQAAEGGVAPLSLEGFLDEALPEATEPEEVMLADNSACYVCHDNYQQEPLSRTHARVDVGCVHCHGESVDHRHDEDNITPPDFMYGAEDVDAVCAECHEHHDVSARAIIERYHKRSAAKKTTQHVACTDCHFDHRLDARVVEWDPETREVLARPASAASRRFLPMGPLEFSGP
jgi:hypothetical protein